jgi:TolB-like protein/class 3 adenylate cyclase
LSGKRVERRLAAILAADVAGYSRLMGADEEGTLAALRTIRRDLGDPKITEHRGRIVKTTGDGLLVEFPSAVSAVRCAIEVQRAMAERNAGLAAERRIEYRIGINLGDIMVDEMGDIFGDGVNIAARLEAMSEVGGVCISAIVRDQVEGKVDCHFEDLGEQFLKNIARPVRVYGMMAQTGGPSAALPVQARPRPPRLSIVVLPFGNIGGDPEQDYFANGVTESLTTDLSRLAGSFVIARNTAFTYKDKPCDVTKIGRDLNVRYVLEGSVQRGGNRIRVNVQLIDAETRHHLWAERFDEPVTDLFNMQDEITARLANELSAELITQEARRAAKTANPDSLDYYFQGRAWYEKSLTRENVTKARRCFERALALDPDNVDALIGFALADFFLGTVLAGDDRAGRLASWERSAKKALSLAPNHAYGHCVLGVGYVWTGRTEEGIAECERALELDCNFAHAHSFIGRAKCMLGRSEETEAHVREALRLSPRDVWAYAWFEFAGSAKLCLRAYEEAIAWLRRSIEANRNFSIAYFNLAAALAHLGRIDEAKLAASAGLTLDPTTTIRHLRSVRPVSHPLYVTQYEHILDGMRLAGVPEG